MEQKEQPLDMSAGAGTGGEIGQVAVGGQGDGGAGKVLGARNHTCGGVKYHDKDIDLHHYWANDYVGRLVQ